MTMKEFGVALDEFYAEENEKDDPGVPFKIAAYDNGRGGENHYSVDARDLLAFKPSEAQYAVLIADVSRHTTTQTKIGGVINFFDSVLDDDGSAYVTRRLLERKDPFGLGDVQEIVEWLVEEWSGRPTRRSPGSTQSRSSGGQKSTPRTRASA